MGKLGFQSIKVKNGLVDVDINFEPRHEISKNVHMRSLIRAFASRLYIL